MTPAILIAAAAALTATGAAPRSDEAQVSEGIVALAEAMTAGDVEATMRRFDPGALLVHPARPDARSDAIRSGFVELYARPQLLKVSAEVEEVQVSRPLAFARITWSFNTPARAAQGLPGARERDMEIWRLGADGRWRLLRGLSFPVPPPAKK